MHFPRVTCNHYQCIFQEWPTTTHLLPSPTFAVPSVKPCDWHICLTWFA